MLVDRDRRSCPEVFIGKGVLERYSEFTGEHPCWSAISMKFQSNFIKNTLWHGRSPINLYICIFLEHFFIKTPLDGFFYVEKLFSMCYFIIFDKWRKIIQKKYQINIGEKILMLWSAKFGSKRSVPEFFLVNILNRNSFPLEPDLLSS